MRRVVIVGSGGAGKSTLAVRLGEILRLEVVRGLSMGAGGRLRLSNFVD